jgi:hypothetical protein
LVTFTGIGYNKAGIIKIKHKMKQIIESEYLSQEAVNEKSSVWGMLENDTEI